jgi:CubicO group peptidase (beta-lactamase class C family)
MKMIRWRAPSAVTVLGLLLLPLCLPAQAATPDLVERVDAVFERWIGDDVPGCAVAAERAGSTVLSRAYGMAELEHGIVNTPATIFEAGSVSKQLTAAAIVLLALEGALSLDDDVRSHVPELPDYGHTITIRHLLNHTSGLRDWGSVASLSGWGRSERSHTHDHVLDILARQSALNYAPGAAYSYTNSGYNLLAMIVGRVSGRSFADFSRERIFEPLGLADTQWRDDYRRIVPGRASAYQARRDGFSIDRPIEHVHGNGGLLTTVGDLLRWDRALASGELGGPEFVRLMHEQGVLNDGRRISYAAGVQIGERNGVPQVSHTGATSGYRAFLARYPDQSLTVALLCNVGAASPGGLGGQVVDLLLEGVVDRPAPAAPPPASQGAPGVPVSTAELRPLVGLYRDVATGEPLSLVLDDGVLRIEGGSRLVPLSPSVFRVGQGDEVLTFEPAPGAERSRIRATVRGADDEPIQLAAYEPVEAYHPTPAQLSAYVGTYHSPDADATFTVMVDDGELVMLRRPADRFSLRAVYPDAFRGPGLVRFHRDGAGRVVELGIRQARVHDIRFQRVDD